MGRIRLTGATSGYTELRAANAAGNNTIILPTTNGGEVIVSDSSGNVNIDSGTFYVDASNNRVGVGTSSPSELLHIAGVTNPAIVLQDTTNNTDARIKTNNNGDLVFEADYNGEAADTRISFEIDGSEKARFDSSGRLGVGTTSPSDTSGFGGTLDINGTTGAACYVRTNGSTTNYGLIGHYNTELYINNNSNGPTRFYTNGNERLRITAAGLIGIGTSSPQVKSHIVDTNGDVLRLQRDGAFTGSWGVKIGQAITGDFTLRDEENNLNVISIPKGTGRVGIGTTTVDERLHISGTGDVKAKIATTSTGSNANAAVQLDAGTEGNWVIQTGNAVSDGLRFYDAQAGSERCRLDASGRLLVGTSTASNNIISQQLASIVYAADNSYTGLNIAGYTGSSQAGAAPILSISRSRGTSDGSLTEVANGDCLGYLLWRGADGAAWSEAATIKAEADGDWTTSGDTTDSPGRLVFSTTADGASSPTERMRIGQNGSVILYNTAYLYPNTDNAVTLGGGTNRFTAVYAVTGTIQTSDQRQKTQIVNSALGSDFIKSLRPVSYKWIEGGNRNTTERDEDGNYIYESVPGVRTHWGFIAQEVKQAVDAAGVDFGGWVLTDKDDPDSTQALRYDQFIAPLTKALQEALEKIETLEAKVAALESA